MVDFVSKETRSKIMSSIRSKNTSIDVKMAKMLRKAGIKFRRYPKMSGNPDFIVRDKRILIFCDGDFWHGYDYKKRKKELPVFWRKKIENNVKRDKRNGLLLRKMGWKVVRLWEHEINNSPEKCINKVLQY
jgi:DNA mismatch endonuclease (patch repair protein)